MEKTGNTEGERSMTLLKINEVAQAAQCQPRYGDQTGEHREAPRASHFLQGGTGQQSGL